MGWEGICFVKEDLLEITNILKTVFGNMKIRTEFNFLWGTVKKL